LSQVLDKEASSVVKNGAFLRLARIGINGAQEAGRIASEDAAQLKEIAVAFANEVFPKKTEQ